MLIHLQRWTWGVGMWILAVSLPLSAQQDSGLRFSTARIVYQQSDKGGAYAELENSSAAPYLIQSWLTSVDPDTGLPNPQRSEGMDSPFMVTPPLTRLAPGERYRWRIQRVNEGQLPEDKESVFYIALKAIPTTNNQGVQAGEFVLSPVIYLKMLYRPQRLENTRIDNVVRQLRFERQGEYLVVNNPTPLSMTFASLQVGAYPIPDTTLSRMVSPFSEQRYPLPKSAKGDVLWRVLNEYGLATKIEQGRLTAKEPQ